MMLRLYFIYLEDIRKVKLSPDLKFGMSQKMHRYVWGIYLNLLARVLNIISNLRYCISATSFMAQSTPWMSRIVK